MNAKSTSAAVLMALLLAACGGSPTRESTGEYVDDSVITTKVKSAFIQDKDVKASDIKVETFKGVVQLSGFVASRTELEKASQVASQVPGVKAVRNDIRLKATDG
ncbi:BON domain-containing protein [Sulfuritalea sp.]|uniref:BON domain-containing protein n=1 Tax=Sulfuritalea sp. TaxID=2480090 RepID=UPI00286E44DF|nr:BON domain-containing protein [Sulfuritalea sp.]